MEKSCLCEDLAASPFVGDGTESRRTSGAVAVCPGPNLAYFSRIATLEEMVGHIYGRFQLISVSDRPNLFVNELRLYLDYLRNQIGTKLESLTANEHRTLTSFRRNLQEGIAYYRALVPKLAKETERYRDLLRAQLRELELELEMLVIPSPCFELVPVESTPRRG